MDGWLVGFDVDFDRGEQPKTHNNRELSQRPLVAISTQLASEYDQALTAIIQTLKDLTDR